MGPDRVASPPVESMLHPPATSRQRPSAWAPVRAARPRGLGCFATARSYGLVATTTDRALGDQWPPPDAGGRASLCPSGGRFVLRRAGRPPPATRCPTPRRSR